jgi:hypothetical protein
MQTIHPDRFSFPCSLGLVFSSICKESDLRVNGSFHGCVDSRFVLVGFSCLLQAIFVDFSCVAFSFDSEVFGLGFDGGNHGYLLRATLFLILIPQTPSSASDQRISVGT